MVGWGWFRRKAVGLVLVFLMMVTVVSGCGSNQEPAKNQSIIKVVLDGEPDHLDYLLSQARIGRTVSDPINATLVTFDSDMQIKPYLAEKWEIVDDTTIRFDLVQGAKFHNGREVVADDVKKTIERIQDPATGSFLRPQLDMVASVDVVDKSTFDLKLKAAYAPMLSVLTRVPIIPIEAAGEMKTKPIGAGPFKFVRWDKGQQVVLEKFGDFFIKGQPKVDQLVFKFVAEYSAAISALETGEVDAVLYVNPVDVSRLKQKGDIYVVDTTLMGFQYVAFVVDRAPWNNKLLRQAVALAIDRDALIQKVEDGFATPALVPIPKSSSLYPEGIQAEHNVEKAKLLVQQVGLKERPVLITPNTPTEGPLGEVIQAQLKEVGIDVELQKLEVPTFVERMFTKKDYGIGICGDTAGGDPDDLLYRYLNSKGTTNICNYEDPEVDRLLLQARQTYDPSTRKDLYRNVTQKLLEDAPIVYLYQAQRHSAIRSQAQNIVFKGDLSYDWREATVERK